MTSDLYYIIQNGKKTSVFPLLTKHSCKLGEEVVQLAGRKKKHFHNIYPLQWGKAMKREKKAEAPAAKLAIMPFNPPQRCQWGARVFGLWLYVFLQSRAKQIKLIVNALHS